jgi:undecaprenyl phosphate-alpha-L-ara4FN deformylase
MQKIGGVRVDIDSVGDIDALPETLDLLDNCDVKASFFVAMGPDKTGKNLFKYLKKPWGLGRARPTRFGFRNLIRGLVSPAHMEDYKSELYEIKKRGHEVGLHGYDHYQWIKTEGKEAGPLIEKGCTLFEEIFESAPRSFASPGFTVNREILHKTEDFDYSSDFIYKEPFYPGLNGEKFDTLQIPVSMKSIGEFEMDGLNNEQILEKYQNKIEKKGFFSFYFHPSYEVKYKVKILSKIIGLLKEKKEILTFTEIAEKWKDENTADL